MDPIADFFIRIKNGYRAKKPAVLIPFSQLKAEITRVLEARGYIGAIEKKGRKVRKFLEIGLLYPDGAPALGGVRLISKPSRRIYLKRNEIRPVRQGHGLLVISTSRGVMSGEDARKAGVGGVAIAEVW
ncbi:MAG: 30S ribosomal protein S8 [Candidatus Sungbacteria bacterium RIFCSPLOWO2_01_FULL_60_25]|uniref:Small ribosomal subunit protein uS8 n=1 Tax=Candidatus Sungbacteria bacterium RIFCSPLOWO2_01_FULL_60_25 TaxID=1802281 RepID=A0A1G2LD37_9BACT|nr:MAG: 30S ribosomal protein S8 [Candidatus Sungbacteria bacterium RIFCSPLOWO2_01_FULL_60_25]